MLPPPPPTTQSRTDSLTLRGGRLRKTNRGFLSFAPFLATASAVALGALLFLATTDSARAQACTEDSSTGGTYVCSGMITEAERISAAMDEELVVTTTPGFSINTASLTALIATGMSGSTGVNMTFGGPITAGGGGTGIQVNHTGEGAVLISAAAITAGGRGIDAQVLTANATTTTINANGAIMAGTEGIEANHQGSGALTINANAAITSTTEEGIVATTTGTTTGATINASGSVTAMAADKSAIFATHAGTGNLEITAATVSGDTGISAAITNDNSDAMSPAGDIIITLDGSVDATASTSPTAVSMTGGGDHTLIFNSGASIASGDAVTSDKTDATLEFAASAGETDASFALPDLANFTGFSVFEKTGDGTWSFTGAQPDDKAFTSATFSAGTLRLNAATFRPGSTAFAIPAAASLEITGASTIHAPLTNAGTLEITGSTATPTTATIMGDVTNSGTFDLDTATLTLGDNSFTNSGTLNVTGTSSITGALTNSGTVFLNAANLTLGSMSAPGTLAVADALNVTGNSSITGNLDNSATGAAISLAMSEEVAINSLTVTGAFTAGGSVTLDMDLTGDTPDADELILNGSASGSDMVTLNLRIAADANLDLTADTPPVAGDMSDPRNLQPVSGSGASGVTFADAGTCTIIGDNSNASCTFTIDPDGTLTALQVAITADTGGAQSAVVESYAASLADIAALSGLASRTANRHYANGNRRGFWAQIAAGQTDTTPSFSSTGSSRDTGITRARFGLDAPLPLADLPLENLAIGANFWLAQTDSDITSRNGKGDIETDTFGFAASATLEHSINSGSMYVDAQLQHATFSSDLTAEGETVQSNHDATSWGAALELGYKLPPALHGISFTPQAQLIWSSIDFDAFTDAADERISIADGETLTARLGIAAETALAALDGATLQASADVLLPLDGETAANLGDSRLISDMQDPALSLTAGGVFPLNATTTLAADLATTQGDEVEEYRANLSARFAF